jgi:cytochrome c-type biogenesis protein CcmF
LLLLIALITHNFSIEYVASYTSRDLPLPYIISALWAGNSGSLLFWAWLLSVFAVVFVVQQRDREKGLVSTAAAVTLIIQAFFLLLLLAVANPFRGTGVIPDDGRGLNPMLENPGMIIHPPALLIGYVGFTIPFAFIIATMFKGGSAGTEWQRSMRQWLMISWLFLGAGNIIGAWWAYVELGWGGYWAWDAVENAGLMPWLVATAALHSMVVQRRTGMFRVWTAVMIILTQNMAIFGTFLTRSNILSSVHTFGDTSLEPFFVVFLIISLAVPYFLLYRNRHNLHSEAAVEDIASREGTFLLNNMLLIGSTAIIFLGTMFPAISELFTGSKVNVGASFFNRVVGPVFLAVILLAGVCVVSIWRQSQAGKMARSLLWPLVASVVLGILLFVLGVRQIYAIVAFFICALVIFAIVKEWLKETGARHRNKAENYARAFWRLMGSDRPRYGGYLVHIGIVLMAIGVIGSSFFDIQREATLAQGGSLKIGQYTLVFDKFTHFETQDKLVLNTDISVSKGDKLLGTMTPQKILHRSYEQPVTEVAIRSTPLEDLYIIFGDFDTRGNFTFKVLVNPLVMWIWVGGGILVLGGVMAFWPEKVHEAVVTRRKRDYLCSKCGTEFVQGDIFCVSCGARLIINNQTPSSKK